MKSILESIRDREQINECGGSIYVGGGCGGGSWVDYNDYYSSQRAEERRKAEKIDKKVVAEYKKLQAAYKRKTNSYYDSNRKAWELTNELGNMKNKAMGISNVVEDLTKLLHEKRSMFMTFTITNSVLKLVSHIIGEEYDESEIVDDKMSQALKNIKEML